MLYGNIEKDAAEKDDDTKFKNMMISFEKLQADLKDQQHFLSRVVGQVNTLLDHREEKN